MLIEILISVVGAVLLLLVGISGYFVKRHIEALDTAFTKMDEITHEFVGLRIAIEKVVVQLQYVADKNEGEHAQIRDRLSSLEELHLHE